MSDLAADCLDMARRAREAARLLAAVPGARKDAWLRRAADTLLDRADDILAANQRDLTAAAEHGLTAAQLDRLRLNPDRLRAAADGLRDVAGLPDPVGQVIDGSVRPNGLVVQKVRVPLGVLLFIYES